MHLTHRHTLGVIENATLANIKNHKLIEMKKRNSSINYLLGILYLVALSSCCGTKNFTIDNELYKGYQPIEPVPSKTVEIYDKAKQGFSIVPWASLNDSIVRTLLPNQSAQVALRSTDIYGKVSYLPASVTYEAGSYEVIMDYMKYLIEDVIVDSVYIGSGRTGIGLRIRASVNTKKANLNLSGLANLGVEASKNNLSGLLTVDIVGIDSKDITSYLPLTAKLDETSIQNALQAIATIKSKIWDDDVKITPHLIAINQNKISTEEILREKLTDASTFSYTNSSELINKYWCPDGKNVNQENENHLKNWMESNNLSTGPGTITKFIYSKEMEELRQKAINDLKLK